MQILIATHNRWKSQLFSPILQEYGFEITTLTDSDFDWEMPVEDGDTVVANALIKARYCYSRMRSWVFADDTGLEIAALNCEPGVQARRWGGRFPNDVDDQVWLDYLLKRMEPVPRGQRTAEFVDGWALLTPDGNEYTRELRASFEISEDPIRPLVPGSPIMSVAIGLPDDPAQILAEARSRWQQWGILDQLFY